VNVVNQLLRTAGLQPDAVALTCGDISLSFGELTARANSFARHLLDAGLEPGDRVGLHMPNCLEWLPSWIGVLQAGGTAVPMNVLLSPTAARHVVDDSGMRWVVTRSSDVERVAGLVDGTDVGIVSTEPAAGASAALSELPAADPVPVVPRLDGDEAMIMYTSGSTGVPKGVRQTHRNTSAQCDAVQLVYSITAADRALVCTPLFHVGGLQLISLPVLLAGGSVTLLTKWDKHEWVNRSLDVGPTIAALVPTMMIDVANAYATEPVVLDSYRVCMIGGSALPDGPLQRFAAATAITCIHNIYGQTEQSGLSATEVADDVKRSRTMGHPLEQILQWQLVDVGDSEPIVGKPDAIGELWVRGDAVTPGYWHSPAGTEDRFVDGWFRTGDMVTQDADGYLYFAERTDDMIISGGENVFPQMVENHLASSPLIAEVAVIGTAHERYVQQVTAIVVPVDPTTTAADIEQWCRTQADLQGLQRPRRIEIVEELPRMANSKLDRMTLKKQFV